MQDERLRRFAVAAPGVSLSAMVKIKTSGEEK
jgi:hypothetical protein